MFFEDKATHIFDVRAWVDSDNVAMLDSQVVTNDTVEPSITIVEVIICKDNQDGILSLLASNEDSVTAEQLKLLHSVVRKCDDGVIIVGGIGNPA